MRENQIRNIFIGLGLMVVVIILGTLGFVFLEDFGFIQAFYMTMITISTVGFKEVAPLDNPGMLFTVFLIIISLGIFGYVLTAFTRLMIEGVFRNYYKNNKVKKRIQKLSGHVIVCGYGRNGRQAVKELEDHNKKFVVIENDPATIEMIRDETEFLFVEGDATHEDILETAGLEKASALITGLPNDADNLFVVLTAHQLNPTLKIISRATEDRSDIKLKRAGADNVIMPDRIGGQRMAKLVVQPDVVEFLEYIMLQSAQDVNLEEVSCQNLATCFTGKSIQEMGIRNFTGANIIGMKKENSYIFNPSPDVTLSSSDQLFVLGKPDQIRTLKKVLQTEEQVG